MGTGQSRSHPLHTHLQNTNITLMEVGPQNLILQDNHKLVAGPLPFIKIPPGHYTVVVNPIDQRCVHTRMYLHMYMYVYVHFNSSILMQYCTSCLPHSFLLCSKCKVEGKLYDLSFGYREIRLHGVGTCTVHLCTSESLSSVHCHCDFPSLDTMYIRGSSKCSSAY